MIVCDLEALKVPCEVVSNLAEAMGFIDKLHSELNRSAVPGIGLAANQIGLNKRIFVLQIPYQGFKLSYAFVNPEVLDLEEPVLVKEGCLSFPDQQVETLRFRKCLVKDSLSPEGRRLNDLAAVAAQHEIDHLNGKTMFDLDFKSFKDDSLCPCNSNKFFGNCCKKKVRKF